MTKLLFVHDGERYLRVDQIESIGETFTTHATDRYSATPTKVKEWHRHVGMLSGAQYSSPGTADELLELVRTVVLEYEAGGPYLDPPLRRSDEGE